MIRFLLRWILPFVIALVPAVVLRWRARGWTRQLDDPALPERLVAARQPHSILTGIVIAVLMVGWPGALVLTIPFAFIASLWASFSIRKALYGERWSFAGYLGFCFRLFAAIWGFWLLLLLAPTLTNWPGWYGWAAAAAVIAVLTLMNARHGDLLRFALRARPIDRPDLVAAFSELAARSDVPLPRFEWVPMRGGAVMNALALPSLRRCGMVFTETMLERLAPAEVIAVAAHEMAHLEHFNPRRLKRMRLVTVAFIVAGALLSPALAAADRSLFVTPFVAWSVALLFFMAALGRHRQQNETASDLRAVALGAEPEALVSALEKIYTFARLPRRFDQAMEQRATHPSLARRVRDIRAAAGAAPPALADDATFTSASGGAASVTFHADRLTWTEGDGASFTMPYAQLTDLRIDAARAKQLRLVAADAKTRRWNLAVAAADVARLQRVLDVVDGMMHAHIAAPAGASPVARLIALLAVLAAIFAGQIAGALALVAFFTPAFPIAAAGGVASLISAVLAWRDGGSRLVGDNAYWPIAVLFLCGAFLLSVAWRSRQTAPPRSAWRFAAFLGLCAVLFTIPILASTVSVVGLHVAARRWPEAGAALLAFAAAMIGWGERRARAAMVLSAALGIAIVAAGSSAVLDLVIRDPMLLHPPQASTVTVTPSDARGFAIDVSPLELRLSPGARSILVIEEDEDEARRLHIGRAGGPLTAIAGEDGWFASDDDLVIVVDDGAATVVRRIAVNAPATALWEQRLADTGYPRLSMNASGTEWRVLLQQRGGGVAGVEGRVDGAGGVRRSRWGRPDVESATAVAAVGDYLLLAEDRYLEDRFGRLLWSMGLRYSLFLSETSLSIVGPQGRVPLAASAFELTCAGQAYGDGAVCTMFDGGRTHVMEISLPSGEVRGVAWMRGEFYAAGHGRGWVSGVFEGGRPAALDLRTGRLIRRAVARGTFSNALAGMDGFVAAVSSNDDAVRIEVHDVGR